MRVSLSLLTALALAAPLAGFAPDNPNSDAAQFATRTGSIAGTATYCRMETDLIEHYIDRAQALIASQTEDDVDLVIARIGFTNSFNVSSSREPAGGCQQFTLEFPDMVKALN